MHNSTEQTNAIGLAQWKEKAEFWNGLHGQQGNGFHRTIVEPMVQHLLQLKPGERVVDAACGSGTMARRLTACGAEVTRCVGSLRETTPPALAARLRRLR